ncbi:MAG TPA: hypothetical protein VHT91_48230 [Kofleriaceae bacterium]|nr:hypothetical protein [Kofleriaceae bacterium]
MVGRIGDEDRAVRGRRHAERQVQLRVGRRSVVAGEPGAVAARLPLGHREQSLRMAAASVAEVQDLAIRIVDVMARQRPSAEAERARVPDPDRGVIAPRQRDFLPGRVGGERGLIRDLAERRGLQVDAVVDQPDVHARERGSRPGPSERVEPIPRERVGQVGCHGRILRVGSHAEHIDVHDRALDPGRHSVAGDRDRDRELGGPPGNAVALVMKRHPRADQVDIVAERLILARDRRRAGHLAALVAAIAVAVCLDRPVRTIRGRLAVVEVEEREMRERDAPVRRAGRSKAGERRELAGRCASEIVGHAVAITIERELAIRSCHHRDDASARLGAPGVAGCDVGPRGDWHADLLVQEIIDVGDDVGVEPHGLRSARLVEAERGRVGVRHGGRDLARHRRWAERAARELGDAQGSVGQRGLGAVLCNCGRMHAGRKQHVHRPRSVAVAYRVARRNLPRRRAVEVDGGRLRRGRQQCDIGQHGVLAPSRSSRALRGEPSGGVDPQRDAPSALDHEVEASAGGRGDRAPLGMAGNADLRAGERCTALVGDPAANHRGPRAREGRLRSVVLHGLPARTALEQELHRVVERDRAGGMDGRRPQPFW